MVTEFKTITVTEPEVYQHCMSEPLAPAAGATFRDWKDYILALKAYGNDCESKVNGGREWIKTHDPQSSDEKPSQNKPESEQD